MHAMESNVLRFSAFCLVFAFAEGWLFPSVCYGSLGCFSNAFPFINALGKLPDSPDEIGTKFYLFTQNSPTDYVELVPSTLTEDKPIKVLIHGFTGSANDQWVVDTIAELLENGDYYVIAVDWSDGTISPFYLQSVANTRVVGAVVAQLLKDLRDEQGFDPSDMHIIGHSLGAHVAGYAGEIFHNIGRITGLDPAGPAFQLYGPRVRLDPTDAVFVDAIHTHGKLLGFGIKKSVGTVDFFPNGGKDQPGCSPLSISVDDLLDDEPLQGLIDDLFCSHRRSVDFFIESINSACTFKSFPCPDVSSPSSCNTCNSGCGYMGFHASSSMNPGDYYLETNAAEPYCVE